jgi:hypothetical protein
MAVKRLLPLSGIVFVVLAVVAIVGIGGDTPTPDDSAAEILAFYDDESVRQAVGAFVLAVSIPFLIFFAGSLASGAWSGTREDAPVWRTTLLMGAAMLGALLLISASLHFALADAADNEVTADAIKGISVVEADTWLAFNAAFGVMMLGAAGVLLAARRAPRWLGWSALVLGIVLFVPFADFIALLISLVWILIASGMLYAASGRDAAVA